MRTTERTALLFLLFRTYFHFFFLQGGRESHEARVEGEARPAEAIIIHTLHQASASGPK